MTMSLTGVLELVKIHPEFRRHLAQVEATGAPATIALRAATTVEMTVSFPIALIIAWRLSRAGAAPSR